MENTSEPQASHPTKQLAPGLNQSRTSGMRHIARHGTERIAALMGAYPAAHNACEIKWSLHRFGEFV